MVKANASVGTKINEKEVAKQVAATLIKKPDMVEDFKGRPYQSIMKISGIDNLSTDDAGSILDVLLSGAGEGEGMLGSLGEILTSGKKTKTGEQNVVGEIIKKVIGNEDSSELIATIVSILLKNAMKNALEDNKSDTPKKSTTPKTSTSNKSTTTSKQSSSGKTSNAGEVIGDILESSGIDVSELIVTILKSGNKK